MKKRILIIDDDPEIFQTLKKRLEFHGFDCDSADSVEAGFERLKEMKPDLILLDLGFRGVDGTAFLKSAGSQLLENESMPPVLVLSCYKDQEIIDHVLANGAVGYIRKPYDPANLVTVVSRFASGEGG
jgi:Response regulators consisting of a CheY-like receiver domain and a winged-helix DNA-binding domain